MDYKTRTRQDRIDFNNAKQKAFEPTIEEIKQEEERQKNAVEESINERITAIWVNVPSEVTKERLISVVNEYNVQQYIWDDVESWIDSQIELHGSAKWAFRYSVLSYL